MKNLKPRQKDKTDPVIGKVLDIGKYVKNDWWRRAFDDVYLTTDGDVVDNDANTKFDIDSILKSISINPNQPIIDIGCGQGRHLLELAKRGYANLLGLDSSPQLIAIAQQRSKNYFPAIRWVESAFADYHVEENHFQLATILGQAFGYAPSRTDDASMLEKIFRTLAPGGSIALDLSDGDWIKKNYIPHSWEWISATELVCRERKLADNHDRLLAREIMIDLNLGQTADRFYAVQLYNQSDITEALTDAGFVNIRIMSDINSHSERNEDLGLMQSRFFAFADKP